MSEFIDLSNQWHGRWYVIQYSRHGSQKSRGLWDCICWCGRRKLVDGHTLRAGISRSCGCLRSEIFRSKKGPQHFNWKSGKHKDWNGYIRVAMHDGNGKRYYKTEHELVMSKYLGRDVLPDESIHHKNGVRDDNRIENLELWVSSHPSGQRVEDAVCHALDVIDRYPEVAAKIRSFRHKEKPS